MTPEFEAALNEAAARLCGHDTEVRNGHTWKLDESGEIDCFGYEVDNHNGPACTRCYYGYCEHCTRPAGIDNECRPIYPRFCTDRNALPSLWEAVEKAVCDFAFYAMLLSESGIKHIPVDSQRHLAFMKIEPSVQVIAALKATENWTPDLQAMYDAEKGEEG